MNLYPDPDLVAQYDISTCLKAKVLPLYKTADTFVVASPESDQTESGVFTEPHAIPESGLFGGIQGVLPQAERRLI